MAIRVTGVPFGVTGAEWAILEDDLKNAHASMAVMAGLAVTSIGTRTVQVASGRCVQAGTRLASDAAFSVPQLPAAVSNPRIDLICAQVQWPANDSADVSDTAGSFVRVPGSEAASPVAPGATQTPGDRWRTPLAQVRVNTNGTMVITDVRPGPSVSATVTMSTGWSSPGSLPLMVERRNGIVFLSGRFTRTSVDLTPGDVGTFSSSVLIPVGFQPERTVSAFYTSDQADSTPTYGKLLIATDGTVTLQQHTGTFASGQTVRVVDQSWIGA